MLKDTRYIKKAKKIEEKKNPLAIQKTPLGFIEEVIIFSPSGKKKRVLARIDTGATTSSIDVDLAAILRMGPIIGTRLIKSASGSSIRPVIEAEIEVKGKQISTEFTIADRTEMKYPILIGQNILENNNFLIDPSTNKIHKE